MSSSGIELITFGCRLNARESDTMRAHAAAAGLDDLVIVNTCAVTSEAERQARQAIRRVRRERPAARIVVTGCAAQIDPGRYAALPEATQILGNREKLNAGTWHDLATAPRVQVADIANPPAHPNHPEGRRGSERERAGEMGEPARTRAYLDVQQGCDHRCTFCVIPYGRGASRSVPVEQAVAEVRRLVDGGAREVVLTGVDLTAWGADLAPALRLGDLVAAILGGVPGLPRLRLSSLDPAEIDDGLLALFAGEPRLMPHLHLSLQSGDDLILKRMKRRHGAGQALDVIARVRARREVTVGADLIAGFPTETDAMFARTLALTADALDLVHVFPYSPRPGTPAARMPQLPAATIRDRAATLRDAARAAEARFLARQVGRTAAVLIERSGRAGHAENFAPVQIETPATPGSIVRVAIEAASGRAVRGRITGERAAA